MRTSPPRGSWGAWVLFGIGIGIGIEPFLHVPFDSDGDTDPDTDPDGRAPARSCGRGPAVNNFPAAPSIIPLPGGLHLQS
jgi:hypothetical protein